MKRGSRILLFLILLIVILAGAAYFVFRLGGNPLGPATPVAAPTQVWTSIVTVGQPIKVNTKISAESLSTMELPPDRVNEKMITNPDDVVGKCAAIDLEQGVPLLQGMVIDECKIEVKPGQVAIAIPITRLSSMAYGIREGDKVNVIVTTMFVDLDSGYQTILPNNMGQIVNVGMEPNSAPLVVLGQNVSGLGSSRTAGRAELDPLLNQAVYLIPSETQRPRLVSQLIAQNIMVLHVGNFDLTSAQPAQPTAPAATPAAGQPAPTPVPVTPPDIITLIVTPQDAISLTYFMFSGAKFTLTLRAPDDDTRAETEAATLQYLLSQYNIPVPSKMTYGFQPRIDSLVDPTAAKTPVATP